MHHVPPSPLTRSEAKHASLRSTYSPERAARDTSSFSPCGRPLRFLNFKEPSSSFFTLTPRKVFNGLMMRLAYCRAIDFYMSIRQGIRVHARVGNLTCTVDNAFAMSLRLRSCSPVLSGCGAPAGERGLRVRRAPFHLYHFYLLSRTLYCHT
jgi:hypothetical protein